ncbi:MAG: hypothetical protein M0P47_12650 [Bacteroidales bacterium]|nr:hypothetical protein [Bacteroidales bacterium]
MKTLSEIIDDCQLNNAIDNESLTYAVLALNSLSNFKSNLIYRIYEKESTDRFDKMKIDNIHKTTKSAMSKTPKEWLGWENDPQNPEYQKFHALGLKLMQKALNGELPNQKKERDSNG